MIAETTTAQVRSIEHRTSNPLDCTRSLCMQSCLAEWENKKQIRTMCLAVSAAENHFGSGSSNATPYLFLLQYSSILALINIQPRPSA